jgi:hypothetical protein
MVDCGNNINSDKLDRRRRLLRGLLDNEQVLTAISGALEGTNENQSSSHLNPESTSANGNANSASARSANNDQKPSVQSEVARLYVPESLPNLVTLLFGGCSIYYSRTFGTLFWNNMKWSAHDVVQPCITIYALYIVKKLVCVVSLYVSYLYTC